MTARLIESPTNYQPPTKGALPMSKLKKTGADAVQAAAMGHNGLNKDTETHYLRIDAQIVEKIAILNEHRKDNLREAKDTGMSKMAIRKATKESRMSLEQRQAQLEVDDQKKHYLALCREIGLFDRMEEAA